MEPQIPAVRDAEQTVAHSVFNLASRSGWTPLPDVRTFVERLSPNPNGGNPDSVLPAYLDGTCTLDGNSMGDRLRAVVAAYHLRNYGGHHLEGRMTLVARYRDVLQTMLNAFFTCIETL